MTMVGSHGIAGISALPGHMDHYCSGSQQPSNECDATSVMGSSEVMEIGGFLAEIVWSS